jgi:hypothetical protein
MTDLSPNAQKALDAFIKGYICNSYGQAYRSGLAAAIRELADQVVCADLTGAPDCCISIMEEIRADILAIATELEGQ